MPARCTPRTSTNFLLHLVKDGKMQMNLDDEITRSTLVTQGGEIVNPRYGSSSGCRLLESAEPRRQGSGYSRSV